MVQLAKYLLRIGRMVKEWMIFGMMKPLIPKENVVFLFQLQSNSQNAPKEFINELKVHHQFITSGIRFLRLYGVSRDPITKNYCAVYSN
ncbi:4826_t:CDS:2, partial [Funneliformis caledonium]